MSKYYKISIVQHRISFTFISHEYAIVQPLISMQFCVIINQTIIKQYHESFKQIETSPAPDLSFSVYRNFYENYRDNQSVFAQISVKNPLKRKIY